MKGEFNLSNEMNKEKDYKIIFESKQNIWVSIIYLALVFILIKIVYKNFKLIDFLINQEITPIIGFSLIGIIIIVILLIICSINFIINFWRWSKQQYGEIIIEEIFFKGNLKKIQEIIEPKQPRERPIKYRTIYGIK